MYLLYFFYILHSVSTISGSWKVKFLNYLSVKMTSKPKSLIKGLQCYIYYVYK